MTSYSKIYKKGHREFRYNYEQSVLECITFESAEFDKDDNIIEIKLEVPEIICSIGLAETSWKDNNKYWVDQYNDEIDEELQYMI